jgi:hypothetical protein
MEPTTCSATTATGRTRPVVRTGGKPGGDAGASGSLAGRGGSGGPGIPPGAGRPGAAQLHRAVPPGPADVGLDPHRAQHRDPDAGLAQLPVQDLGQGHHAVFGHAVRAQTEVGGQARERRREQQVAATTLLDHPGKERLHAMDRAPQVDVQHPCPIGMRHVDRRAGHGYAGVVEHHVGPAETVVSTPGQGVDRLLGSHIGHDLSHLTRTPELPGGFVQPVCFDVGQHQPPTLLGQQASGGQTDAARPSRYDRDTLVVCRERHKEQSCRRRRGGRRGRRPRPRPPAPPLPASRHARTPPMPDPR